MSAGRYAIVTPARDEADNLAVLAGCVLAQTVPPLAWIVVDDGSTDATAEVVAALARRHPWVRLLPLRAPPDSGIADGRRHGRVPVALEAGIATVGAGAEVIVKLDADLTLPPDHMERVLKPFEGDPALGLASGRRHEWRGGRWHPVAPSRTAVEAQCRAFRRRCLEELLPFERRMGWDGVDEVKAVLRGWRTRLVPDAPFFHRRPMGRRDGSRVRAWRSQGEAAHYMGYRPSYLLARACHQVLAEPAAAGLIAGFAASTARQRPRCPDPMVRRYVRAGQRLREVPRRAREIAR